MSKRTLLRNVYLFDPANNHDGPGGVVLYGERIVAVFGGDSAIAADADVVIDGHGATLLPGLIDSRVPLSEPGLDCVVESTVAVQNGGVICGQVEIFAVRDEQGHLGSVSARIEDLLGDKRQVVKVR